MVRAALVKSDALMRSLGRPNRDQIVTMRPSELTTLEAIDLANGETLATAIEKGAKQWLPAGGESTAQVVKRLYLAALSPPSHRHRISSRGRNARPAAHQRNMQDLLWAIFMLPEFQLVR